MRLQNPEPGNKSTSISSLSDVISRIRIYGSGQHTADVGDGWNVWQRRVLVPQKNARSAILGSEDESNGVLFVLFIPSKDKDGDPLPSGQDQQLWAAAAGDMLTRIFGGATIMPPAKGKWLNEETNKIITEEVVLVHSYARSEDAADEKKLLKLARFLHRLGNETKQGEVAVVVGDVFHRIRKFTLA